MPAAVDFIELIVELPDQENNRLCILYSRP